LNISLAIIRISLAVYSNFDTSVACRPIAMPIVAAWAFSRSVMRSLELQVATAKRVQSRPWWREKGHSIGVFTGRLPGMIIPEI
jgi:hypothetical protein